MNAATEICGLIKKICGAKKVARQTELLDIGLDSLLFVELIVSIEDALGVIFGDEELDIYAYKTADDIIKITEAKLSGKKC